MAQRRMDIVTTNLPEVAMHLKRLAVAITGALMLCASTGIAGAHGMTDHSQTYQANKSVPEAPGKVAESGVTVIERTLGEDPAETIVVSQGTTVRLVLHAPAGLELHLHGYNLSGSSADGAPVIMTFRADYAGRFPIEAHGTQADALGRTDSGLAYLEVRPE